MTTQPVTQEKKETTLQEGQERTRECRIFLPAVDIFETKDELVLIADMPGVDEKGVDITLENDVLTLRGRVETSFPEGYQPAYAEYDVGDFERTFTLSEEVDRDNIQATIKNGVLKLVLPKSAAAKTKKIQVKAA